MIKRSAAIVLTLLYLVTTVGFALNLHYCFNRITSVSFDAQAKNCGMAVRQMKCCKQTHLIVKVNDAHQGKALSSSLLLPFAKLLPANLPAFLQLDQQAVAGFNYWVSSPDPPDCGVTPYLKNCVFRI